MISQYITFGIVVIASITVINYKQVNSASTSRQKIDDITSIKDFVGPSFFADLYKLLKRVILDSMCRHLDSKLCQVNSDEFDYFGVGLRNISLKQIVDRSMRDTDFNLSPGLGEIVDQMLLSPDFSSSSMLLAQCNTCLHFPLLTNCDKLKNELKAKYVKCKARSISAHCSKLVNITETAFNVLIR